MSEELPEEKTYQLEDDEREDLKAARRHRRMTNKRSAILEEELDALHESLSATKAELIQLKGQIDQLFVMFNER